jgi:class 3 adenylate cyclase/tetratricopeptide (TPR) repeat protein
MPKSSEATTLSELDRGLPALAAYLPGVASREPLASAAGPVTRDAVTLFADLSGFTSLSERLALHGTAGTEELGKLIRRTIGGALDAVADHGGDALAFGGDAITAAFESAYAWEEARGAAADIIALVTDARGTPTLAGPVELSVRIGVGGGSVTSEVFAASTRYVLAHVGPGLDAAVLAQQKAQPNGVTVEGVRLELGLPPSVVALPAWAERTLHPVTAQRVAAGGGPPDEHRHVTSVFVSVPPVVTELGGFVATAADMIDELGGDVLQCAGGDKGVVLFAVFGAPVAHADDAARAVHAIERLRGLTGVDFAAGIASGLAFPAAFGGRSRIFLGALGRTTNLAARLMSAAGKGVTLVDERTGAALRGRATLRDTEPKSLKGITDPVRVAAVESLLAGGREFDSTGATPIVGRAEELAAAEELLDRVGGILRVEGVPGSGKSRLAGEIARRARIRGLRVYEGAFDAFGLGRPLAPIADLLRLVLGDHDEVAPAIDRILPGQGVLAPLLGPLLNRPLEDTPLTAGLDDDARAELREQLVVDVLCADDVPTLAVLEDLHWADELSLRALAALESRLAGTRLALVTTSRPGVADTVSPLPELPESDIAAIVRDTWSRLGGGQLPDTYVKTLVDRAAGSPLFAETVTELARHGARPGQPLPAVPLPDQLLPVLTMQLDDLGDSAQETALRAAVLGRPATGAELADVFGGDPATVEQHLGLLVDAAIARRAGARTWLRHATVAEALLARAAHGTRAPLHERVCRHLIEHDAPAREVARHLQHCRAPDVEVGYLRQARSDAWSAWALEEARRWGELAVARDGTDDAADQLVLAELEQQLGDYGAALERLARIPDSPDVAVGIARLRGRIALENGRPQEAADQLARAEVAGAIDGTVSWPLTIALCELGRFDEARARASQQLAAAGSDEPRLRLDALANLGAVLLHEGDVERADEVLEQARTLAQSLGDVMRLAHVTGDLAGARFMAGRLAEAASLLDEATGLAHGLGARRVVAMTLGNLSQIRLAAGDQDGAQRAALAGAEAALGIGDVVNALNFAQVPAVVAELEGELKRSAAWWRRQADLEQRLGRPVDAAICGLREAVVLAAGGDVVDARNAIERANRVADGASTNDLELHRQRALDACAGSYGPPPEADTTPIELPPLDAALPTVTPAVVDALFERIESRGLQAQTSGLASARRSRS